MSVELKRNSASNDYGVVQKSTTGCSQMLLTSVNRKSRKKNKTE